jgi:hypothetical protein
MKLIDEKLSLPQGKNLSDTCISSADTLRQEHTFAGIDSRNAQQYKIRNQA